MNTSELVKQFSKELEVPLRKAEEIVDTFFDTMIKQLFVRGANRDKRIRFFLGP